MTVTVRDLGSRIKIMKSKGYTYIPVFGAGISYSSGIPKSPRIKREVMQIVAPGTEPSRFDEVWRSLSEKEQHAVLSSFLEGKEPSTGYQYLFKFIQANYFPVILTFNFDDLIEKTLERNGYRDLETLVVGFDPEPTIRERLAKSEKKLKLIKLHGCLRRKRYYYSLDQVFEFHPDVKELFTELSSEHLLVCGYSFNDLDVIRAVSLEGAGHIYYVNIRSPGRVVREILRRRKSIQNSIIGKHGDFDVFFEKLAKEVFQT